MKAHWDAKHPGEQMPAAPADDMSAAAPAADDAAAPVDETQGM
jgi:hypothetical protein